MIDFYSFCQPAFAVVDVQPQPQAMDGNDSDSDPLDVACLDIHDSLLLGTVGVTVSGWLSSIVFGFEFDCVIVIADWLVDG